MAATLDKAVFEPQRVQSLNQRLLSWQAEREQKTPAEILPIAISDHEADVLRSLGYIGN